MATEKTHALYVPESPFEEGESKRNRSECSAKSIISWILTAVLIALLVALCTQFLYPVVERKYVDTVHIYTSNIPDTRTEEKQTGASAWQLDFLINPTRLCDTRNAPESEAYGIDPEIKLLVLVPSAISHFEHRKAIRNSWGSVARQPYGPVRLGFVLGWTHNSTLSQQVTLESQEYGDVIQVDLEDTYRNLTAKSVLMLKWVSAHCAHAQYFLKADDDTFVNIRVLQNLLEKEAFRQGKFVGGFVHKGARPTRLPTDKYFVPDDEYEFESYPPYVSGSAYLTNGPTACELGEAVQRLPMLSMEDVFVTGLGAQDIGAELVHEPLFVYVDPPRPLEWDAYSNLAAAHSVSPEEIETLWDMMTKSIFDGLPFSDRSALSSMNSLDPKKQEPISLDLGSSNFLDSMFPEYSTFTEEKSNGLWDFSDLFGSKGSGSSGGQSVGLLMTNGETQVLQGDAVKHLNKIFDQVFDWPETMFLQNFRNFPSKQQVFREEALGDESVKEGEATLDNVHVNLSLKLAEE